MFVQRTGKERKRETVKSRNLMILSVWSVLTIFFIPFTLLGATHSSNPQQWLIWVFQDWLTVFFATLIFTGIIVLFKKEPEVEFQTVGLRLDTLSKEVKELKKTLEE